MRNRVCLAVVALLFWEGSHGRHAPALAATPDPGVSRIARALFFEPNLGQLARGDFSARGLNYNLSLSSAGVDLVVAQREPHDTPRRIGLELRLLGARPSVPAGLTLQQGQSNYYVGSPSRWRTAVPHYSRVRYPGVYDGIDVIYYGTSERELEYDFVVAPGADPSRIELMFEGASGLALNEHGDLAISAAGATILQRAPVAYQEIAGVRTPVVSAYAIHEGVVSLVVGKYNRGLPLVIDPVLSYSTFLGGSGEEFPSKVLLGKFGNPIVVGRATSPDIAPNPLVPYTASEPAGDVFLLGLTPDGHSVQFVTYFGGSADDWVLDAELDSQGNVVAGLGSQSVDVPTTPNALQRLWPCNQSCVYVGMLAKFSVTGELLWSTFLSSDMWTSIQAVSIGSNDDVYVVGRGEVAGFPLVNPFAQATSAEGNFVARVSSAGDQVLASSFLDDAGTEVYLNDAAVDTADRLVLMLEAYGAGIPTTQGPPHAGDGDVLIIRLHPGASGIERSTYFGGSSYDGAQAIAASPDGGIWIGGMTRSLDLPVIAPLGPPSAPNASGVREADILIAKFSDALVPVFATHWGGTEFEHVTGLVIEAGGSVAFFGNTRSVDYPVVSPLMSPPPFCDVDGSCALSNGFITRFSANGSAALFSSRIGRAASGPFDFQFVKAAATVADGSIWLTGVTSNSGATPNGFPVTADALWPAPTSESPIVPFLLRIGGGSEPPNESPVARAGADFIRAADGECRAAVVLDGASSSDPNDDGLTYTWRRGDTTLGTTAVLQQELALGSHTFTLTVDDGRGLTGSDDVTVTIEDLASPSLTVPGDVVLEQATSQGTAFSPPAPQVADNCSANPGLTITPSPGTFQPGATTVTYTATDDAGNAVSDTMVVTVRDSISPVIASIVATPSSLWPANHKMVTVNFNVVASDAATSVSCAISGVTSNEQANGAGGGNTATDWTYSGLTAQLRAERSGSGTGRVYTAEISCSDASGNTARKNAFVTVPHDRR